MNPHLLAATCLLYACGMTWAWYTEHTTLQHARAELRYWHRRHDEALTLRHADLAHHTPPSPEPPTPPVA